MDADVHKLLLAYDDEGFYVPHDDDAAFPFQELSDSVNRLRERIRAELDIDISRDGNVQDASFLDDLKVLRPIEGKRNHFYCAFGVRFSNFGRLFTIFGEDAKEFPSERVRRLVEGEGWTYVPEDQLQESYDGGIEELRKEGASWWHRFFDYVGAPYVE